MTAIDGMAGLAALATTIAALELIWVRGALSDWGVFAWPILRRELATAPRVIRGLADATFSYRGTLALLALQLAGGLALPWLQHPAPAWIAFGTTLLIAIRFRGSYNGGSDAMLLIVLLALGLARTAPGTDVAAAGLAYAAAQLVLSYVIAGIAKLGDPAWRDGSALAILTNLPHYRVPVRMRRLAARPMLVRVLAWAMLAFECTFPVALVHPTVCVIYLSIGAMFHLANALAFGLDRFLWTWLAAYPALIYWVERRA